ncbi:MAG: hypothetical protein ACMVP2_02755 [Imperialibacter sp.]|uniref:hypothetical protein n=1 Tax=Imperialibacter sp. TaxID=2038411 RepID=UPI0030D7AA4B
MKNRLVLTLFMCLAATVALSQSGITPGTGNIKPTPVRPFDTLSYLSPLNIPGNKVHPFVFKNFNSDNEIDINIADDLPGQIAESSDDRMPMFVPKGDYTMPILTPGDSAKNYTLLRKHIE